MTTTPSTLRAMRAGAEASGLRLLGHHDLAGHGDGMQVAKRGDVVYVAHLGTSPMALSILDCSDPGAPRLLRQLPHPPGTHRHKVQIAGDLLLQNSERPYFAPTQPDPAPVTGLCVFDLADPVDPRQVGFYPVVGDGVHRLWYLEPPYAHIAAWLPEVAGRAYHVVDLSDPAAPARAGAWWIPSGHAADAEVWPRLRPGERFEVHGVIALGDRAYAACTDAGMVILDIADPGAPEVVSRIDWSPPYGGFVHTCLPLPGRGLVIAVDEVLPEHVHGGDKRIWVVDVREERQPVTIATMPVPRPGPGAPWSSYRERPGRFGPHNVHENKPGSLVSEQLVYATYYNAGVRVYDVSDPYRPEEVAHFVPPTPPGQDAPQCNDLWVDAHGLVYVTDRISGGLYVLEPLF
jgi:hypothetical protein